MRYALPLLAVIALSSLPACGDASSENDSKSRDGVGSGSSSSSQEKVGGPSQAPRGTVLFSDVSSASGLTLQNVSGDAKEKMAIPENIGQGGATLDYDGDGLLDLFIANGDVFEGTKDRGPTRCALYRNLGGFKFEDVTEKAGLVFEGWAHGAWVVDFDADGHQDLYVTCYRRANLFFRNLGNGKFEDVTKTWGGADAGPSTAAAFFDADRDGDLDLYVANYVWYDPKSPPNSGNPCEWKGLLVSCGPRGTKAAADTFWENTGDKLVEATKKFGFDGVKPAYGLGVVVCDVDNDRDLDVYVANDSVGNFLFENDGKGKFSEKAFLYAVEMSEDGRAQAGMGVDCGDVDNDGRLDLFVTNFSHDTNTLYRNEKTPDGRTLFNDSTYVVKLGESSFDKLSWGTRIIDVDLDGWQDIVVVSGHVYPQVSTANLGTTYAQRNQVFHNQGRDAKGRLSFKEVDAPSGDGFAKLACSRGLVSADLDNDGAIDFLFVEMDSTPTLLRNETKGRGHWVGLELRGKGKNRDAIGARVTVTHGESTAHRERSFGSSYLSSCDPRLLVGLGSHKGTVSVTVTWPDGTTHTIPDLAADRYWRLDQSDGKAHAVK